MFLFHLQVGVLCASSDLARTAISKFPQNVSPTSFSDWTALAASPPSSLDLIVHLTADATEDGPPVPPEIPVIVADGNVERTPAQWEALLLSAVGRKPPKHPLHQMIGISRAILEVKRKLVKAADSEFPILLTGENGTGKDMAAKSAHELSPRKHGEFIPINCGAIPVGLAESQMFGSVKGAFTGAENLTGFCQSANGGTLFLDEVGELPLEIQAKFLRVLENKEIRRVGSEKTELVDFRLICATNRRLADAVRLGQFREDLYYRINVLEIRLPALRERTEDIPLLAQHFSKVKLSHDAMDKLCKHSWPGNLRQLRTVLIRAQTFHGGPLLEAHHLDLMET